MRAPSCFEIRGEVEKIVDLLRVGLFDGKEIHGKEGSLGWVCEKFKFCLNEICLPEAFCRTARFDGSINGGWSDLLVGFGARVCRDAVEQTF